MSKAAKLREELAEEAKYHSCGSLEQAFARSAPCLLWRPAFALSRSQSSAWSLQGMPNPSNSLSTLSWGKPHRDGGDQLAKQENAQQPEQDRPLFRGGCMNARGSNGNGRLRWEGRLSWMLSRTSALLLSDYPASFCSPAIFPILVESCSVSQEVEQAKNLSKMNCFLRHRLSHFMICRCSLQPQPFCDMDV